MFTMKSYFIVTLKLCPLTGTCIPNFQERVIFYYWPTVSYKWFLKKLWVFAFRITLYYAISYKTAFFSLLLTSYALAMALLKLNSILLPKDLQFPDIGATLNCDLIMLSLYPTLQRFGLSLRQPIALCFPK